ncbi:MAG: CvpA family protein [Eubacterium sp.]|nr:CvpA family protein [Eubacterium sp.]
MYYITFCVIAILLICALVGLKRGLFKTLFGFLALVLSIGVTYVARPVITNYIIESTDIDERIEEKIYTKVQRELQQQVAEALKDTGVTTGLSDITEEETNLLLSVDPDKATQIQMIDNFDMPETFKQAFINNNNESMYDKLGADSFYKYIAKYTAYLIINVATFVALFLIIRLILFLIGLIIGWVMKEAPVLSGINRLGGLVFGLGVGCVLIWVFMIIAGIAFGSKYDEMISGNVVLETIDKYNLLMKLFVSS